MTMHPGQLDVTEVDVRELVDEQFPEWREMPVQSLPLQGTVNALFRLGEQLIARFPLVPGDLDDVRVALESEAQAARELLDRTKFLTPEPVAIGAPGPSYPMPWSVQTWLPGTVADKDATANSTALAQDLADLITDVRAIPTRGRSFRGTGRGGSLPDHDAWVHTCLERSRTLVDVEPLRRLWTQLRGLPMSPGSPVMTHGDLIPANLIVTDERLTGVIDVGGLGPADRALDLVVAWHLFNETPREALRAALGVDDVQWARGAAWALEQALGLGWYYLDSNPRMSSLGLRTLERLTAQFSPGA